MSYVHRLPFVQIMIKKLQWYFPLYVSLSLANIYHIHWCKHAFILYTEHHYYYIVDVGNFNLLNYFSNKSKSDPYTYFIALVLTMNGKDGGLSTKLAEYYS